MFEKSRPEKTKSAPLLDELIAIAKHPIKTHTILIDDRRLIGTVDLACPGWAELTEELVIEAIMAINPEYEISYRDTKHGKQDVIVARIEEGERW